MHTTSKRSVPVRALFLATLFAATLVALVGCDDLSEPTSPGQPAVASVTVTPAAPSLEVGDTITLRAIVRSAAGDTLTRTITWSSSDPSRATVSPAGLVTALAEGPVAIRASAGNKTGQAMMAIGPQQGPAPVITGLDPAVVAAGGPELTLTIVGTGFAEDARVQFNGHARPTSYVGADEVRATIPAGDIAAIGQATVNVVNPTAGTVSAPVVFRIIAQQNPVVRLDVRPALAITRIGAGVMLTATPVDGAGNPAEGRLVTWHSSNELVATVNGQGMVTPVGEGEVVITARSEGREANSIISVHRDVSYHMLVGDGTGLASIDLRLNVGPSRFWQHWPGSRILDPSPSPDGRFIVYAIEDQSRQLAIMDKATRTYVFIPGTGVADQPAWSPNGDVIAFRRRIADRTFIFTVRPDGTGLTNLTPNLGPESSALDPAWSPDGTRIVYAVETVNGFNGLRILNVDGTGGQALTIGGLDTQPAWIGHAIAFTRRDPFTGATDVYRIAPTGGAWTRLTTSGIAHSPAWSPDQQWIAYIEGISGGAGRVMAMKPFGEEQRAISANSASASSPVWVVQK